MAALGVLEVLEVLGDLEVPEAQVEALAMRLGAMMTILETAIIMMMKMARGMRIKTVTPLAEPVWHSCLAESARMSSAERSRKARPARSSSSSAACQ